MQRAKNIALGVTAVAAGLAWATRRKAAVLKPDQLAAALAAFEPSLSDGEKARRVHDQCVSQVGLEQRGSLTEDNIRSVVASYEVGRDFVWIGGGGNFGPEPIHAMSDYMMRAHIELMCRYGHVLVCRERGTGRFLGVALLGDPGHAVKDWLYVFVSIIKGLGAPPCQQPLGKARKEGWGKLVNNRFESWTKALADEHHKAMKKRDHWHLGMLCVAPDAQRQGVGQALLHAVFALSDQSGAPVYLECHDGNVEYYKRAGFVHTARFEVRGGDMVPLPYNGMLREVVSKR